MPSARHRRTDHPAAQPDQTNALHPDARAAAPILQLLTQRRLPPWRQMLAEQPRNGISGHQYRGVNRWLTAAAILLQGYSDPRFLTHNQVAATGGALRKSAQGHHLIYYPTFDMPDGRTFRTINTYTLFNVRQTTGCALPDLPPPHQIPTDPHAAAEAIIAAMPHTPLVDLSPDSDQPPTYNPQSDRLTVPNIRTFQNAALYYHTLFQELARATAHPTRMNRPPVNTTPFNQDGLAADMAAAILCQRTGLQIPCPPATTAYVTGWIRAIQTNNQLPARAAAQADTVARYIDPTMSHPDDCPEPHDEDTAHP